MTGVLTAALALSWVAIGLLAAGYAALTVQVRELRGPGGPAGLAGPARVHELAAPRARTVVLVVAQSCGTCRTVFPAWGNAARLLRARGLHTAVLSADGSAHWELDPEDRLVLQSQLSAPLLLAYQPALAVVDHHGAVRSTEPVGSVRRLEELCAALAADGTAVPGER
ncbi:hypothetical protein GCM10010124_12240 [Pilimelia terevasa]|uniref:Thioredoxin domain-containing protein n=1 Tax=Pilimelia terevasa TaxID=53372 RepID=A0A8J3BHB1_9ACTN|nr:hypothetical protein [Pilimelia terevasa]GGK21297.1 hypothetical protein GCM10010124_12240 [Pilimelia terevasa]